MDTATQVRLTQAVRRIMKPVSRAVILCLLVTASVSAQVWQQPVEAMSGPPSARQNAAAIYDPVADRVVLMGGRGSSGDLNDTWALDLSTLQWSRLVLSGADAPMVARTFARSNNSPRQRQRLLRGIHTMPSTTLDLTKC
jgi:hypothetical protein